MEANPTLSRHRTSEGEVIYTRDARGRLQVWQTGRGHEPRPATCSTHTHAEPERLDPSATDDAHGRVVLVIPDLRRFVGRRRWRRTARDAVVRTAVSSAETAGRPLLVVAGVAGVSAAFPHVVTGSEVRAAHHRAETTLRRALAAAHPGPRRPGCFTVRAVPLGDVRSTVAGEVGPDDHVWSIDDHGTRRRRPAGG